MDDEEPDNNDEDWPPLPLPPSLAGVKLVDAPVLFLVVSHKAFRSELASIRRSAVVYSPQLVVDLFRRLDFLKLVYKYHCEAEDEVIFLALDAHVQNVVSTYSLEHRSIDDSFDAVFYHLDLLMNKEEGASQIFQDLIFSIGTVQALICQHMQKEEEQVFPLLKEKFTCEEQSQLVWQYICSVPIILLEDFFPWMTFYLSSVERLDVLNCIKLIIPKERLLLEVVVSWLQHKESTSSDAYNIYGKGYQILNGILSSKGILELYPPQGHGIPKQKVEEANGFEYPIKGIVLWHVALIREFNQIIEELYQIRSSNCFSNISSVIVQLKFIIDVLILYSNSLEKIFFPLLRQFAKDSLSPCIQLIDENQIECLQRLLFYERHGTTRFIEMLCKELESLVRVFSKNLTFLELEVFPLISSNCTPEVQLWLLYTSLRVMPLGLLRCTVTWFTAQLSDSQFNSILKNMKVGCSEINESFTSLLYEWVRIGTSGKSSTEKFRRNLEEMFNNKSFYLAKHIRPKAVLSSELLEPNSETENRRSAAIPSSSFSVESKELDIIHSSGMNLHIFFSQMFKRLPSFQRNLSESDFATHATLEPRPMNHILHIHRALVKDLDYLVSLSAKLAVNVGLLSEFQKGYKLLHNIYQIHSNSEDVIAFPALESKGALQNISHSYGLDHKLEALQFEKTSRILNELSEFHEEGSNGTTLKHYQLSLKLHDSCLSMHKVLSDHIFREEVEIFPLFREFFSIEEEEKVVGQMLGRTTAEILQQMVPWLMGYLTSDEQQSIMSLWLKVTRYTNFNEWLGEWWEDMTRYNISTVENESRPSPTLAVDPLEVVSVYLLKDGDGHERTLKTSSLENFEHSGSCNVERESHVCGGQHGIQSREFNQYPSEVDKKRFKETNDRCHVDKAELCEKECQNLSHQEHPLCMNQEELEATIRRVSRDSTLDGQKKSYIIQNLITSRWMVRQKISNQVAALANDNGEIPGQTPSYQDSLKLTFGCKHYKRNCKLFTPCCKKLYTCIRCHDELNTDHTVDRKAITQMMCMKCLTLQPIGSKCANFSCDGFSMARYYCSICKLFEDERIIYHCPYCNLCRVGKGLGIDYFHCMKCNACMHKDLFVHVCREKCLEDNCPICHEFIFTSNAPVKALPCGHLMHSTCFQEYTCSNYICPICSKSLGDMQVYFGMLDALLAEEKIPEEYSNQTQVVLCNDCQKKGTASFHWLYHKCSHCGSYNTRLM